ncbi:MAG: hypothetical protein M3Z03_04350, partial [Actinomycetota bacterium]|nr:hypothetical protein [Actinomycetota bacterium]
MTGSTRGQALSGGLVICTIVAHNYLPQARVLARSVEKHHPDARFVVCVVDHPDEVKKTSLDWCELLTVGDIEFGPIGWRRMATMYDVTEFATSVKPFVLRHLVDQADCVLYLDPDIELFDN